MEGKVQFIIFKQIFCELEAKKAREPRSTKFQAQFQAGMSYLEKRSQDYDVIIDDSIKDNDELTDDFLVRKVVELKEKNIRVFLATNDQLLRRKARDRSIGVIFLRQKKYLSIERF